MYMLGSFLIMAIDVVDMHSLYDCGLYEIDVAISMLALAIHAKTNAWMRSLCERVSA